MEPEGPCARPAESSGRHPSANAEATLEQKVAGASPGEPLEAGGCWGHGLPRNDACPGSGAGGRPQAGRLDPTFSGPPASGADRSLAAHEAQALTRCPTPGAGSLAPELPAGPSPPPAPARGPARAGRGRRKGRPGRRSKGR